MNRWSDQVFDRRIAEAFADAAETQPPPTALRERLAELGEPVAPGSSGDHETPNRARWWYLAVAAACVVAMAGALVVADDRRTTVEPASAVEPDVSDAAGTEAGTEDDGSADRATLSVPATGQGEIPAGDSAPTPQPTTTLGTTTTLETTTTLGASTTLGATAAPQATTVPQAVADGSYLPAAPMDDPNPLFDGVEGRLPVSQNPVPSGYPTPLSTGFAAGGVDLGDLVPMSGLSITEPTVLDGVDIDGSVQIRSSDVTIRNSRITASGLYAIHVHPGVENVVIENTRVRAVGADVSAALYLQGRATLRGLDISGGSANIKAVSGFVLEDSYLSGLYRSSETARTSYNIQIRQGSDITIRGNAAIAPWQASSGSAIRVEADNGAVQVAEVTANYLSGGGYTLSTGRDGGDFVDVRLIDNRIEAQSWGRGWLTNRGQAAVEGNQQLPS